MVSASEFWQHVLGVSVIVVAQLICLGIFAVSYLPTFSTQPLAQQLTIVVAGIMFILFVLIFLTALATTIIYERPGLEDE
jgi:hypothetical protein